MIDTSKIKKNIGEELNACKLRNEIEKVVIEPYSQRLETFEGNEVELILVVKKDEYFIAYDDVAKEYGVAFINIVNQFVYLGGSGSLCDAYEDLISRDNPSDDKKVQGKKSFKPTWKKKRYDHD